MIINTLKNILKNLNEYLIDIIGFLCIGVVIFSLIGFGNLGKTEIFNITILGLIFLIYGQVRKIKKQVFTLKMDMM